MRQEARTINAQEIKKDFPLLQRKFYDKQLVYLDSASTTQKPSVVIESLKEFYEKYNANVHRGIYKLSEEATQLYESAREKIAKFVGARPEELIFAKSCTEAINLLAYSLELKEGDEILISEMEHHSNFVPWQQIAKEKKAKLRFVKVDEEGKLDLESLKAQLNEKTKIVSITHVSNVLGTINPIKEIADIVHKNSSAVFIVDAAQSVGHMKINVKDLDADFLAFSGHKMLGPVGIGCLYGKAELLQKMKPFLYGGDMIKEVTFEKTEFNDLPWKFEAGTQPIAEAIALAKAIEYLEQIEMDTVEEHDRILTQYALEKLRELGAKIYGPNERAPVISFNLEGIHSHDIATILDGEAIAVRGGHHCCMPLMSVLGISGAARVSFYIYNTKEDVDALIEGIKKVKKVFE